MEEHKCIRKVLGPGCIQIGLGFIDFVIILPTKLVLNDVSARIKDVFLLCYYAGDIDDHSGGFHDFIMARLGLERELREAVQKNIGARQCC